MINSQWAKNFSKVQAKKLVYSNESIQQNIYFSWIPIFHNSFFFIGLFSKFSYPQRPDMKKILPTTLLLSRQIR